MFSILLISSLVTGTLLSVVEVCRHGARSPLAKFKWDTYDWEVNQAELTHEGMMQHYLMGRELRFRYITSQATLPQTYNLTQIYVRSTDTSRTVMSAQAHMFGLYPTGPRLTKDSNQYTAVPPFTDDNFNETIEKTGFYALPYMYQPVAIDVAGQSEDYVLAIWGQTCPRIKELVSKVEKSQGYRDRVENYNKSLKNRLEKALGLENIEFEEVGRMADSLENIEFAGFADPNKMLGDIYGEVLGIRNYSVSFAFDEDEALDLVSSGVFLEIVNTFKRFVDGKGERRFSLYMTHDTALVAYLRKMKKYEGYNPPFASNIVFELHQEDGEYFVKVFYNDEQLKLEFCELSCGFEKFVEFVNSWAVKESKEACVLKGKQLMTFIENRYYDTLS